MLSKTQIEKRNAYFAYLIQNKEQTQEDFITLMNSDDKDLKDKVSQIFGKFEKFFSEAGSTDALVPVVQLSITSPKAPFAVL